MTPRDYRAFVRACLPDAAFLRRGRDSLFVTNAPEKGGYDKQALRSSGFLLAEKNGLLLLEPGEELLYSLENAFPAPPDSLSRGLFRFRLTGSFHLPLFSLCCRAADEKKWDEKADRLLRRSAAVALRTGNGGGLYGAALALFDLP